jgi:hypothetical protein
VTALAATGVAAITYVIATPATGSGAAPVSTALVSGQVLNASVPVKGASINLTVWPNQAELSKLPVGATVSTRSIASIVTDAKGNYTLSPDLASLPAAYREPDGTVNLEMDATSTATTQEWNIPTAIPGSAAAAMSTVAVATARPAGVSFNLGKATVTTRLAGSTRAHAVTTAKAPSRSALARPGGNSAQTVTPDGPPFEGGCAAWVTGATVVNNPERFMNLYAMTQAHASLAEKVGSSHTLGVAINYGSGGYSVSGSVAMHTTTSAGGTLSYSANRTVYNSVNYRQYSRRCYHSYGSEVEHEAKPAGFYDLQSKSAAISPITWTACSAPKSSGTWVKNQGSNVEFSVGVTLPFASVNSQAGFSADTEITWSPTASVVVCGNTENGWIISPQAGVHGKIVTCQPGKPC